MVKVWDIDPSQKDLKTIKHTYTYDPVGNMLSEYKRGKGRLTTGEYPTDPVA